MSLVDWSTLYQLWRQPDQRDNDAPPARRTDPASVVRLSQYYQLAEQQWSCRVAAEFAGEVPEAIAPLKGSDGESVFLWQGQPITVWPFVIGAPLNRQNLVELRQAARLLARLQEAARAFPRLGEGHAPERDDTEEVVRQVRDEIRARVEKLVGELNAA